MTQSTVKQRRPRRIAADEAHAWARNLRLKNPFAKLVLSMLTIYVNGEGSCFVGASTLAEDCELALETVRRRLAWLESIGAIARFPQWIDENGKRNSDARGRRTTDDIRLMINTDPEEIEARAHGEDEPNDDGETSASNPPPDRGSPSDSSDEEKSVAPTLAPQRPTHCGGGLSSEPEPEDSPQAPLRGDAGEPDGWSEFKTVWESDGVPIGKPSLAKDRIIALTPAERMRALKAAKGYLHHRSREKKPSAKIAAQNFLREIEAFDGWAKLAPPDPIARTEYPKGTPEFRALAVFAMLQLREAIKTDKLSGPPQISQQFLALAQFADGEGVVDRTRWIELNPDNDQHAQPIGAWRNFIKDRSRQWVEFEDIAVIGADGQPEVSTREWNGQTLKFPKTRKGLLVPILYPPRKDGSIGPPQEKSDAA